MNLLLFKVFLKKRPPLISVQNAIAGGSKFSSEVQATKKWGTQLEGNSLCKKCSDLYWFLPQDILIRFVGQSHGTFPWTRLTNIAHQQSLMIFESSGWFKKGEKSIGSLFFDYQLQWFGQFFWLSNGDL